VTFKLGNFPVMVAKYLILVNWLMTVRPSRS